MRIPEPQKTMFARMLEIYAIRLQYSNEDLRSQLASFIQAASRPFVTDELDQLLEGARVALDRKFLGMDPHNEYTAALEAINPDLLKFDFCRECESWSRGATAHVLNCRKLKP